MNGPKVLIAEDEPHILRVMSMWLTRQGYRVFEARHGGEALDYLRREPMDVLISDMNMPGVDGLTLIKKVREELKLDLPVFFLTARCDQDRLTQQLRPFNVHLYPKPFVPSRLVAAIDLILKDAVRG
jgi:CheY-like chemotaxis protein